MIFLNWEKLTQDKLNNLNNVKYSMYVYIISCYIIVEEKSTLFWSTPDWSKLFKRIIRYSSSSGKFQIWLQYDLMYRGRRSYMR